MKATINHIAHKILKLHTLEPRNSDRLDFHELSVWQIKDALQAAYIAGAKSKPRSPRRKLSRVLTRLLTTGENLVAAFDDAIGADEPEFKKFAKAVSIARQCCKGDLS